MSEISFIELRPRNPATRAQIIVRLAGGGAAMPYRYLNQEYLAGLIERPRFSASLNFDESGWNGGTVPSITALSFMPSADSRMNALAAHYWPGAPIWIDGGEETAPLTRLLTGTVADVAVQSGILVINVADLSEAANRNILSPPFLGTGGIEGPAEATGRPKRRSWGVVANIEGRLLDAANEIYEFGDPARPSQAITALRDKGREGPFNIVNWQGSIAATFAALQAAAPPQGGGVAAPSINAAKWWTQPAGPLTADLQGETLGGYTNSVAGIAARILAAAAAAATPAIAAPALTIANFAAAELLRPGIAGMHADSENETAARLLDRLLLGVSLLWILQPSGQVILRPWSFVPPPSEPAPETLNAIFVRRTRSLPPVGQVSVGYRRNHRVHGDGEISAALLLDDGTDVAEAIEASRTGGNLVIGASDVANIALHSPRVVREIIAATPGSTARDHNRLLFNTGSGLAAATFNNNGFIDVSPGETIWAASDFYPANASHDLRIALTFYDAGDNVIVTAYPVMAQPGPAVWSNAKGSSIVPEGAVKMIAGFQSLTQSSGNWYAANPFVGRFMPGADVTANSQIMATMSPSEIIYRTSTGAPKPNEYPRVIAPMVLRGGVDIRALNEVSYVVTTKGIAATVNNTNGDSRKGQVTVTSGTSGYVALTVKINNAAVALLQTNFIMQDDAAPSQTGGSGGTSGSKSANDGSIAPITSNQYAQVTSVDSGENIFTLNLAAGERLVGEGVLTYQYYAPPATEYPNYDSGNYENTVTNSGSDLVDAVWRYRTVGTVVWADLGPVMTGSTSSYAEYTYSAPEENPGSISIAQSRSALAPSIYEMALFAKGRETQTSIVFQNGSATARAAI